MTSGMIVINEPVITRFWIAWPPAVLAWSFHWFKPIVSGYRVDYLSKINGRK